MKNLLLALCILSTIIAVVYAYCLFFKGNKTRPAKHIYTDVDKSYVVPQEALVDLVCALINDCIQTSSRQQTPDEKNIMKKYNSPTALSARRAAAVMIAIDVSWSCLDASNENIKKICDAFVLEYSKSYNISHHFPPIAKILENREDLGETYLKVAKYITHVVNPYLDAVENLMLTIHAQGEVMLVLEAAANLFKTIKVENSGRIVLLDK